MLSHPIQNDGISLLRRLPEKPVGLAVENFQFSSGNPVFQCFGLEQMVAAGFVVIADQDQRRHAHVAEPVGRFPVVARDAEVDVLRKLGVGRAGEL